MSDNTIETLRNHLFDTLAALKDQEKPMEVARARAICDVAERITDTARVELELMNITKQRVASNFLPPSDGDYPPAALPGTPKVLPASAPRPVPTNNPHVTRTVERPAPGVTVTTNRTR